MATKLEIFNSVYVKLGASLVTDTATDNKRNNLLNAVYDTIKQKQLREHPWNFAIKRVQLTPNVAVPAYKYYSSYDLPSDYLKVKHVRYDYDYAIEGSLLVTEEGLATVGTDTQEWISAGTLLATNHEAQVNDIIEINGERRLATAVTVDRITLSSALPSAPSIGTEFTIYRPADMYIEYIADVAESTFTADFAECLAWILAAEIAYALVQNKELANETLQKAEQMKRLARSMDAQEGTPPELTDDSFINVRL